MCMQCNAHQWHIQWNPCRTHLTCQGTTAPRRHTRCLDVPHNNDNQHQHNHDYECDDAQHGAALPLRLLRTHQLLHTLLNLHMCGHTVNTTAGAAASKTTTCAEPGQTLTLCCGMRCAVLRCSMAAIAILATSKPSTHPAPPEPTLQHGQGTGRAP